MASLNNRADALGQAVLRHGLYVSAEESSVVPASLAGQCLDPGTGGERGAGFVECDMPIGANSKDLNVYTAGVRYGSFVRLAGAHQVGGQPVRAIHMSRIDIDLVDELVSDDIPVPLRMVGRQPDVLVKHERPRFR